MINFAVRRLLSAVVLLACIVTIAFLFLNLFTDEIPRRILGEAAAPEQIAIKRAELGLDQPLLTRFGEWLAHAVTGDLGRSWFTGEPVTSAISNRVGVSASLIIVTIVTAVVLATVLGVVAAVAGGWLDRFTQVLSVVGFAVPSFLIALALVTVFSIQLGWFPATGYVPIWLSPAAWAASITLAVTALAIDVIASLAQQLRGSLVDELERDYVRTLRSRGLSERRVVLKHALRNAASPALAVVALKFIGLLGGAVIVEQVFALPGLGDLAVRATYRGDAPVVIGIVVLTTVLVVVVNLLVDLAQVALNPRIRLS